MADPIDIVAIVGDEVTLEFEADELFVGNIDIKFTMSRLDGVPGKPRPSVPQTFFKRSLPVVTVKPKKKGKKPTPPGKLRSAVLFTVFAPPADLQSKVVVFTFEASGKGTSGATQRARSINRLRVPGIAVTDLPILQTIMLHEFSKAKGKDFVFDPAPLEAVIAGLTREQRKLLANYPLEGRPARLVAFITLTGDTGKPMFADSCPRKRRAPPDSVHSNATFSIFACRGPGEVATLVCHTENYVVNMDNPDTARFFRLPQKGKTPNDWLSPNNRTPPKFLVASHCADFTDSVIWSRVFTSKGHDIMKGNTAHGIINTVGCWMMFRNYNWPVTLRTEFFRIYSNIFRQHTVESLLETKKAIARFGYNLNSTENEFDITKDTISSPSKWMYGDLNYAYNFFFRHIVGVEFFSVRNTFYDRATNFHNPHGKVFEPTMLRSEILTDHFQFHDVRNRREADKNSTFEPPDSLWVTNALGFKTAAGFLSTGLWKQELDLDTLKERSWADWYFYKPRSLSLSDATDTTRGPVP